MDKFYNRRFVVGFIVKERALKRRNGKTIDWAVQGETKLFSFPDAYPLTSLTKNGTAKHIRIRTLSPEETSNVLQHFKGKHNILKTCLNELKRLGDATK
jgi:hypothetical protein